METISHTAYRSSIKLAQEKGSFPLLDKDNYLEGEFIQTLPDSICDAISQHGIRNSHLTAIAPTGTISLLAGNLSSGIEPVFAFELQRYILQDGTRRPYQLEDYAWRLWRQSNNGTPPTKTFVCAQELEPEIHLQMQAVVQAHVDNSISKTINIPVEYDYSEFKSVYELAYQLGLKSCTVFRPNPVTGEVLRSRKESLEGEHCCNVFL